MAFEIVKDPEVEFNETLRSEIGWGDVASGLTKVLMGYAVLMVGTATGIGLLVLSMFNSLTDEAVKSGGKPSNAALWQLYLGLGILSVIGMISFSIIVGGQFKCLLHAAERHGARWFMFLCIACLFFGPAFEIASGIANWEAISTIKQNPKGIKELHLNPLGRWLQLIGFAISLLYPLSFTLFLRAIAVCLRLPKNVMVVDMFLVFGGMLVAATGYALYMLPRGAGHLPPAQAVLLGLGWVAIIVFYLALIAITRVCIVATMSKVKSPLEM